jgi:hypothetical protein
MSSWMFDEERRAFAKLVLLELFDQALCDHNRLGEASLSDHEQGGRPSGRPPAGDRILNPWGEPSIPDTTGSSSRERLRESFVLLNKDVEGEITAAEERRLAEIAESFGDPELAYPWWERAAASGDEDAKDYLEILKEDMGMCGDGAAEVRLSGFQLTVSHVRTLQHLCGGEPRVAEKELRDLFREIEQFLSNPDQVADGGRRI